ncbi:MAG: DUF1761 domain-containing protein [Silvanigrellaceae bacterium]|nr:DUF1761 domain-containing protein [Silvanigrellaceae bacterium]
MVIYDVPISLAAVIVAAIVYFILGAIWYSPALFGHRAVIHREGEPDLVVKETHPIGSYIGEFILDLIMAFVLTVLITLSDAETYWEGMTIALWAWVGFIATTHFSAVLWGRKTLRSFFIHAIFMLVGLLAMGAVIMYFL